MKITRRQIRNMIRESINEGGWGIPDIPGLPTPDEADFIEILENAWKKVRKPFDESVKEHTAECIEDLAKEKGIMDKIKIVIKGPSEEDRRKVVQCVVEKTAEDGVDISMDTAEAALDAFLEGAQEVVEEMGISIPLSLI
jgi:ferritin-like metal-binding protein YciE